MSRIEIGPSIQNVVGKMKKHRLYGSEGFRPTGGKIQGETARKKVEKYKQGRPLARIAGVAPSIMDTSGVLGNFFRTNNVSPIYNDGLGDEDDFNVALVVNRHIKEVAPCFGAIERNSLAILYKNNEFNLNTNRFATSEFTLQCNPLDIIPPQVFNYSIYQIQEQEAKLFPDVYRTRTPHDFWKDFSVDGVPSDITPVSNRASVFVQGGSLLDGTEVTNPNACTKMATMICKGRVSIANYWGAGIKPGSDVYFVIKKFEPQDYVHDYTQGTKILTNNCAKKKQATNDCALNPLTPYQLAFFALPNGGPVPPEIVRYYDEEGNYRTDGLVVKLGTVTQVPLGHVFREMSSKLKPFTGTLPQSPLAQYNFFDDRVIDSNNHNNMHRNIQICLNTDDGTLQV